MILAKSPVYLLVAVCIDVVSLATSFLSCNSHTSDGQRWFIDLWVSVIDLYNFLKSILNCHFAWAMFQRNSRNLYRGSEEHVCALLSCLHLYSIIARSAKGNNFQCQWVCEPRSVPQGKLKASKRYIPCFSGPLIAPGSLETTLTNPLSTVLGITKFKTHQNLTIAIVRDESEKFLYLDLFAPRVIHWFSLMIRTTSIFPGEGQNGWSGSVVTIKSTRIRMR